MLFTTALLKMERYVVLLVPMDVMWAQYTWVSLIGLTENKWVRQVDPAITTNGYKVTTLGYFI